MRLDGEGIDVRLNLVLRQLQSPLVRLRSFAERAAMLEEAVRWSVGGKASSGQMMNVLSAAGTIGAGLRTRGLEDMFAEYEPEMFERPEVALLYLNVTMRSGLWGWYEGDAEGDLGGLLDRVFARGVEEWNGGALTELVELARANRGVEVIERFVGELFSSDPSRILRVGELGAEGILSLMRFAAEMGRTEWFEGGLAEIARWLETGGESVDVDVDAETVLALILKLSSVAYEYGQEELFDKQFRKVVIRNSKWARLAVERMDSPELFLTVRALRESGWGRGWVELMLRHRGRGLLHRVQPRVLLELLAVERKSWGSVARQTGRRYRDEWIDGLAGPLQEKVLVTLEVAHATDSFDMFDRRFKVGWVNSEADGNRWRIVLMEPRGTVVLHIPTLSVRTVNAFRWLLGALGRREALDELEGTLGWSSESGRQGRSRGLGRRLGEALRRGFWGRGE